MAHPVVALYRDRPVGRFHGSFASHVAVVVLANGRVHCRGWGTRVDAEAALERARQRESGLLYAEVQETQPDLAGRRGPLQRVFPPQWFGKAAPGAAAGER
jgi:hypothetical protein